MAEKLNKVFGIISYFPNNDSEYHIETRRERSRRFRELLYKLEELWSDVDIMVIAQNWQDFELPEIKNKIIQYNYGKLGILGARKELRKRFLDSDYDYLIMLDDDAMVSSDNPQEYLDEIDKHPNGIGVIRKVQCPLSFFAISKHIYSQVELPEIDAEKGEGFEDDIFTATCFSKFPDKAYVFPQGLVSEKSFRYDGPGKCPSTWAKEKKYDWGYMRSHTKSVVAALEHPTELSEPDISYTGVPSIDLLITYVNGSDNTWIKDFIRTTKTHNPTATRFRSWGTLRYLFRGIAAYMPFIRDVVLIVSGPTQVPVWLDTKKVRIVYHDEFIPKEYLPTFNSCTIESFFWNIKGLSDRVIYFNDDMFPIFPMTEDDFFTEDVPHIKFIDLRTYYNKNIFDCQCRSGIDLITNALGIPGIPAGKMFRPWHISTAITKQGFEYIRDMCAETIAKSVSKLRATQNVNQYIYAYYYYFTNNYIDDSVSYTYFEITDKSLKDICNEILDGSHKMVCLNDSDKLKDYARVRYLLQNAMARKFPDPCKYEL